MALPHSASSQPDRPPRVFLSDRLVLTGFGIALFFWLLDTLVRTALSGEVDVFKMILGFDMLNTWTRLLMLCLTIVFGAHAQLRINALAQAQEAVRAGEARFRTLVEQSFFGILIVQDGGIRYHNPMAPSLLAVLPESLRIADMRAHPDDRPHLDAMIQAIDSHADGGWEGEMRLMAKTDGDGASGVWVRCGVHPIPYEGGRAALVNLVDITRTKELERLAIVREKTMLLGRLATGMAHEIRNPVSTIGLYLDAGGGAIEADPDLSLMARHARDALSRIGGIVDRVIAFSRAGNMVRRPAQLAGVVDSAAALCAPLADQAGVRVQSEMAAGLPDLVMDAQRMEQVFVGLITHAIRRLSEASVSGAIRIRAEESGGQVAVRITAEGVRFSPEDLDRLFDPFFTPEKGEADAGLALCQHVVSGHGGTLHIQNDAAGGAFILFIPR